MNIATLRNYKDFVFQSVILSHKETWLIDKPKVDVLGHLLDLKIGRIILDYSQIKIDPRRLENLTNTVYISLGIF